MIETEWKYYLKQDRLPIRSGHDLDEIYGLNTKLDDDIIEITITLNLPQSAHPNSDPGVEHFE